MTLRFTSIDLDDALQLELRPFYDPRIDLRWKGNQLSDFLKNEAKRFAIKLLEVHDMGQAVMEKRSARVLKVIGEWRDGTRLDHPGMIVDSLAPKVVDTALAMFISTAFCERDARGEVVMPCQYFMLDFADKTPSYRVRLSELSPFVFVGEPVAFLSSPPKGNAYADAVFVGAAPEGKGRVGNVERIVSLSEVNAPINFSVIA